MARPLPTTFDKDSPMSPQSAISYQTNVNRQKTRKWAEAKPANYGGDDWGSDDEYDSPPPPPKPTGFRQKGQAIEPPAVDNQKKYGDLPPLPESNVPRGRANSFERGDEKRSFSSGIARQPSPVKTSNAPATRFSQITGVPTVRNASGPPALSISTQQPPQAPSGPRKASQVVSPVSGSPHPDILQPGRVNTGEVNPTVSPQSDTRTPSATSDYQGRRDYSPSAVPPPLATRASPAPQSTTESPATRFPARKSSLSQVTGPEEVTPRPWLAGRSASPGASARAAAPTPTSKALPFIRPADIYRRVEEEKKEKERQSMESVGRPSMDSLLGGKPSDRPESPAKPHLGEKSSSDSLGTGARGRTSLEADEIPDSGRRLISSLQPVQERKSEYGFEDFDPSAQHEPSNIAAQKPAQPQNNQLDIEEARRQSVSPKLPDLTRISGFGMDIFTQPLPADPVITTSKEDTTTATTSPNAQLASTSPEDMSLRNQPSFGFRSVVHQAFDETSIPNTPASGTGSGVKRTDSESTGTAGISPIISRVSSTANPETRNRDMTTPSIPEAVNETSSPKVAVKPTLEESHQEQPPAPAFKQGHRRDISTPSPGNSPAKTPDLATANVKLDEHYAVVDSTSPPINEGTSSRPTGEREHSFRPAIPGGWTSYANTDVSEVSTNPREPQKVTTPSTESVDKEDIEITPTTAKHPLPKTAHEATIAGAAVLGVAGASLGRQDSPTHSEVRLPTPDLSMAPGGNLYSTNHPDPRLGVLPTLEKAPQETQLRPDVVDRPLSTTSSISPPAPPPKDTPVLGSEESDSEYFQKPTVPLKQKTVGQVISDETSHPSPRPNILPNLSTESTEYDQESDKLTKEIVRSLSPRMSRVYQDSTLPDPLDDGGVGRESTYLPREYDNYWASTAEEENPVPTNIPANHAEEKPQVNTAAALSPLSATTSDDPNVGSLSPRPLTPRKPEGAANPALSRPQVQSRFSWERSSEDVSLPRQARESTTNAQEMPTEPTPGRLTSPDSNSPNIAIPTELPANFERPAGAELSAMPIVPQATSIADKEAVRTEQPSDTTKDYNATGDAAILGGAAIALGGVTRTLDSSTSQEAGRRLSLAEEKDPRVSSYPVSPTPPESEHPAHSPQPYFPPEHQTFSPAPPSTVSPITSPIAHQVSPTVTQGKLLNFREIAAMKSPQQRIQTYNEMRHRFAGMNSGLNDWIVRTQAHNPEHANATSSWGGSRTSYPAGTARSKFAKSSSGGAQPQLQQPYYQQYLNASSPAVPTTPDSRPGPGAGPSMQPNSQQGVSPTGNKLTSQQVQAKGKEFFHTAGVIGGKAGKAGKGLFAKGKNKLRGAGGGDKESPPPPKSKADRRTSWGIPLSLSKSSGKSDASPRSTNENVTMQPPNSQRGRSGTLNSATYVPPQLPASAIASRNSLDTRSATASMGNIGTQQQPEPTIFKVRGSESHEDEGGDTLAPPAPLSKFQPTWDPVGATPIAEEEVTQFFELPKQAKASLDSPPKHVQSISNDARSKSERSNSGDAKFYDAQEGPAEVDKDWVMVEPISESNSNEVRDVVATTSSIEPINTTRGVLAQEQGVGPVLEPQTGEEPKKSLDLPRPSIMDRPRGSIEIPSSSDQPRRSMESSIMHRPRGSTSSNPSLPLSSPLKISSSAQPTLTNPPVQQQQQMQFSGQQAPVQSASLASHPPQTEPEKPTTASSFLPPIRRTSTFGLGFGSRHAKPRFPIDDDDEEVPGTTSQGHPPTAPQAIPVAVSSKTTVPTAGEMSHGSPHNDPQATLQERGGPFQQVIDSYRPTPPQGPLPNQQQQQQQRPASSFFVNRPPLGQNTQPEQHHRAASHSHPPPVFIPQGGVAALQRPEFTQSHVEWKPNRPKVVTSSSSQGSAAYWKEQDIPPPRNSWEPQHQRRNSNSGQRPGDGPPWLGAVQQPPSSAKRYPDLFRQDQSQPPHDTEFNKETDDLPPHMYQAPIPRSAAFLPRQQGNEYQLPGVGPPPLDEPRPASSRRNSGIWKEIGGRISRASSRERRNSMSREGPPDRNLDSRGNENDESTVTSEDSQEKQKRRSSFFGNLTRSSTGGMPPHSRESIIAHSAGSRPDLLASEQPSPVSQHDRKRSFFGSTSSPVEPKQSNKLMRVSTGGLSAQEEPGKKKRFSTLSGLFKGSQLKDSPQQRPQATRELSYNERQPLESPQLGPKHNMTLPEQHQNGLPGSNDRSPAVNSVGPSPGGPARHGQSPGPIKEQPLPHNSPIRGQPQSQTQALNREPTLPNVRPAASLDSRRQGPPNQPLQSQAVQRGLINPEPEIKYEPPPGPPPSHFLRQANSPSPANGQGHVEPPRTTNTGPPQNARRQSESTNMPRYREPPSSAQQRDSPSSARGYQPDPRVLNASSSPAQILKMTQPDSRINSSQSISQRPSSTTRGVLTKLTGSGTSEKPRQESKPRKQSGSSFMSGLMGRKSKDDRSSEDSRSQGSQPRSAQVLPRAQTYTDLQEQEPYTPPQQQEIPKQDSYTQPQERGRRASREPQYDSVPIPGGYNLVRAQGGMAVPTEYDPRGLNRLQQQPQVDPRFSQRPQYGPPLNSQAPSQSRNQGYTVPQQRYDSTRQTPNPNSSQPQQASRSGPNLSATETYSRDRSAPRRLSREDMLARSPPKSPVGQQRPYQISLPGEPEDRPPPPIDKDIPDFPIPPKHDSIQRLQKPLLRHPESPAGYPLPEDDVFSPVNDAARNFPAPPPPKWPSDQQDLLHARHASVSTVGPDSAGLDRSNTHRTAVSAVSGLSGPQDSPRHSTGAGALNVPNQREERLGHISSPSPTPPSPLPGTPERNVSPEREQHQQAGQGQIKTTVLEVQHRSEDLYDASPRLPKAPHANERGDKTLAEDSEKENIHPIENGLERQPRASVEEKIPYQHPRSTEGLAELDDHEPGTSMSATSYPGQEWMPTFYED